jgi:hypothetical protein
MRLKLDRRHLNPELILEKCANFVKVSFRMYCNNMAAVQKSCLLFCMMAITNLPLQLGTEVWYGYRS